MDLAPSFSLTVFVVEAPLHTEMKPKENGFFSAAHWIAPELVEDLLEVLKRQ